MNNRIILKTAAAIASLILAFIANANTESNNVTPQTQFKTVSPGPFTLPLAGNTNDIFLLAANGSDTQTAPKSLFYKNSISFSELAEKSYSGQISDYMDGDTPYFRGTYESVVKLAADVSNVPELKPVVIYQFNEAVGDMVLVANSSIQHLSDLCGKEIIAPDNGYSTAMLNVLNTSFTCDDKPSIKWSSSHDIIDLLETGKLVASFVSGYSLKNANLGEFKYHILLNDTVVPGISGDVLAVRSDFYENKRYLVNRLVKGIEQSKMKIQGVASDARNVEPLDRLSLSMSVLMTGNEGVTAIVRDHLIRLSDEHVNVNAVLFNRRSHELFDEKVELANKALLNLGIINKPAEPILGDMYDQLLSYDEALKLDSHDSIKSSVGDVKSSMFTFSVEYIIGQTDFSQNQYAAVYDEVAKLLEAFPGTSLVISGHSDPFNFIQALERKASFSELNKIKQADKNNSLILAEEVMTSLLKRLESRGIDTEQFHFLTQGKGISEPKSGKCNHGVCRPKSWSEWKSNLRVDIDIVPTQSSQFGIRGVSNEQ